MEQRKLWIGYKVGYSPSYKNLLVYIDSMVQFWWARQLYALTFTTWIKIWTTLDVLISWSDLDLKFFSILEFSLQRYDES